MDKGTIKSFKSVFQKEELLAKTIELLPYPIQIYAPDGTSVYVNRAMLEEYHVSSPDKIVGKYNIFQDPVIAASGEANAVKRAFQGETVFFQDVRVPLEDITARYGIDDLDLEAVYQDITLFPIPDAEKRVVYVAAMLINRRVYRGKDEIEKAKEYLESHWKDEFDLNKIARAACLSKTHFSKLFKKHTGLTPYEYYINYKINKLKEKLLDANLTIAQAFAACNMVYNGRSAGKYKAVTGYSPSEYRKIYGRRQVDE
ncbi:MAG TPA: AraC family transcriptional regulator [Clostridiales bacterium]|jgi:AraC family transcriptional regulator|nr:AraC family transcriptional regulator [Clostridiales bacterium]